MAHQKGNGGVISKNVDINRPLLLWNYVQKQSTICELKDKTIHVINKIEPHLCQNSREIMFYDT